MKFTIKKTANPNNGERIMDGYHYVPESRDYIDYDNVAGTKYEDCTPVEFENRMADDVDSFYEGWDGCICEDECGDLYLVEYDWKSNRPIIWCRIEKDN